VQNRISILAVAAAVVLAFALAACGSTTASHSTTVAASAPRHSSTGAASAPEATGASFHLGSICSCSGVQAAGLADMQNVSQVWADSVNAAGGINGHPVKLTVMDDGGNPATALRDVKELVQSDHIQALVSDGSFADESFASYIASAGVPVLGGISASLPFLTNPDFFATGATLPVQTIGVSGLAKAAGSKKLGVMYCSETPLCAQFIPIAKAAAQLSGLGFASVAISSTAPSYAAPCLAMKGAGVDALFVADNNSIVQRVVAACAQQGYKPAVVTETGEAATSWLQDPNFNGAILASSNPGYTDSANPGVAAYLAAIKRYDPSLRPSGAFTYDTFYPWIAGQLFETAAQAGKLTPSSTPSQVKQALYGVNGTTLGGLSAPLPIANGKPVFSPCYYGVAIKNGAYVALNAGKPTCLTTAQTTALLAALKKA
jgi:branched-chain amino acid transport system substrate-binding protein